MIESDVLEYEYIYIHTYTERLIRKHWRIQEFQNVDGVKFFRGYGLIRPEKNKNINGP